MTGTGEETAADEAETQARVFAFLADPVTYGQAGAAEIKRIDTHGAVVFLAGAAAYKVKRAVRFPFMDFSSLEKRRTACEHEIEVNRRNAPAFYLGTVPIRQSAQGLCLGGETGPIIEWAVHLKRFDETQTFERLAEKGALDLSLMAPLAAAIASAHRQAPIGSHGATAMLYRRLCDTLDGIAAASDIFASPIVGAFRMQCLDRFAAIEALLQKRAQAAQVRLCHGDLHLRNIVLHNGRPVLFDAIEFDDTIATCDVLYDFAFVLMDLWQRGLKAQASQLFNLYLWRITDIEETLEGLAALPLFLAQRAAIRARVTAALCRLEPQWRPEKMTEAQRFFAAAQGFLETLPARLVAVGGLSGSGKSTLAKRLAPSLGCAPGAVHLRSDVERKRLFKIGYDEKLPDDAYKPEVTLIIYKQLRTLAARALKAGHSVILDAVHAKQEERDAVAALAAEVNVPFQGLWLDAPTETLVARVEARENDASDAKESVVRQQLAYDLGEITWTKLDAGRDSDALADAVLKMREG